MARWIAGVVCIGLGITQETFGFFWGNHALPGVDTGDEVDANESRTNESYEDQAKTEDVGSDRLEWWIFSTFWGHGRWSGAKGGPHHADGGGDGRWFSTPDNPGRLSEEAGWAWYFVDGAGVYLCGAWWPLTAWAFGGILCVASMGVLTYSLQQLLAPVRWLGRCVVWIGSLCPCCCRRRDETLAFLPSAPGAPTTIEWRGPGTGWPTETRYLQEKVKGRGSRRRLNDVVIRCEGNVARLQQDESNLKRIDTYGLRMRIANITGCTSRQLRRQLEEAGEVHLCRAGDCGLDHPLHIKEFAGVDREALLDLHYHAQGSPRWILGVMWRSCFYCIYCLGYFLTCACRCCRCGRRSRRVSGANGSTRELNPDSESEPEIDDTTCQAVRVGLVLEGEMRPLAPNGCSDQACQEDTTLLDDDSLVSDVRPPAPGQFASVCLCTHHRQLYQTASAKRKCGVLICYRVAKGAKHGVPLCFEHMEEHEGGSHARKDSPHPRGLLVGLRRRFNRRDNAGRSRSPHPGQGHRSERGEDHGRGVPQGGPQEPVPTRGTPAAPRAHTVDLGQVGIPSPPRGPTGGCVAGSKVWVKLRLGRADEKERRWYQYMGEVESECHQVRGSLKVRVRIPTLEGSILVDPDFIDYHDAKKDVEAAGSYANRMLRECPTEAEELGVDVKCYHIPEGAEERLAAWDGRCVSDGRRMAQPRTEEVRRQLPNYLRKHAMGCAEGIVWPTYPAEAELGLDRRVREPAVGPDAESNTQRIAVARGEAEDARRCESTRRRSRSRSRSHSLGRVMREIDDAGHPEEPAEPEEDAVGMTEAYRVAMGSGQSKEEAVATIEMVFEVGESDVKKVLRGYLQRKPAAKRNQEVAEACIQILNHYGRTALPAVEEPVEVKPPPGLGGDRLFVRRSTEAGLIKPLAGKETGNPLLQGDQLVAQLFRGSEASRLGDGTVRAGALGDEGEVGARMVHVLEGIRKATEGDKKGTPGSRSAIGAEEALDVYLARGCNTLRVEVCPDATGKELFDGLKRACGHSKALIQSIEWPCLITNAIAYGLAAMAHGGKDHLTMAPWALGVAHAVTATPRDFDSYDMPKDDKIEPKPRHPTHFATWLKQARNEIKMIGSVLGLEHMAGRREALEQIEKAHEADPEAWPEAFCFSLWEELKAAWVEELRESRRRLCKVLNTDIPRKEDLKFIALAPGSGFHFPTTFQLDDPQGYYQTVCVPRQNRAIKSIIYSQLHVKRAAPSKVGEVPGNQEQDEIEESTKAGRVRKSDKVKPPKDPKDKEGRAYPAGKKLRPKEASDSVKHAPKTKEGKPICWDAACHIGCNRTSCAHAHSPIGGIRGLHWTALAQFLRRGGLKSGPMVSPQQVDGRIAQLRAQARQEQNEKVEEGGKQGWLPPEEYDAVEYTALEDDLRELTRGPQHEWLEDAHGKARKLWDEKARHPEAERRDEEMRKLEEAGAFEGIEKCSHYLQSHVRSRILNEVIEGGEISLEEVLLEATERGCRELAEEAAKYLEARGHQVGREDTPMSAGLVRQHGTVRKAMGLGDSNSNAKGSTMTGSTSTTRMR